FRFSDEVEQGLNSRKSSKPIEGKDRDEIWTDFLKGTKSLCDNFIDAFMQGKGNFSQIPTPPPVLFLLCLPAVCGWASTAFRRAAPTSSNRLTDAIKRLKSSTLSTGVPKISVLEKSRLDWESFTEREGIKDDLKLHNKGKNGYVERKAFEARTQEREYQILKEARLKSIQRR
ncbi:unnamed protein product, partial [Hydatigera taeniaeformis]|uniref:Craniofacial development protein 1 n=1 Tax=Hydatigena taeniaeformis TaxID=6205 RepID=A0A0R3X074_HYDTA